MASRLKHSFSLALMGGVMAGINHLTDGSVQKNFSDVFEKMKNTELSLDGVKDFFTKDGSMDWQATLGSVGALATAGFGLRHAYGILKGTPAEDADPTSGMGWGTKLALAGTVLAGLTGAAYALNGDIKKEVENKISDASDTISEQANNASGALKGAYESIMGKDLPDELDVAPTENPYTAQDLSSALGGFAGASSDPLVAQNAPLSYHKDGLGFNDSSFNNKTNQVATPGQNTKDLGYDYEAYEHS